MPAGTQTSPQPTRRHLTLVFSAPPDAGPRSSPLEKPGGTPTDDAPWGSSGPAVSGRIRSARVRGRDRVALAPSARALRRSVQQRALAQGTAVDADVLSIILAAKTTNHIAPITLFTEEMVWQLVWIDVFTWCANRRVDVPDTVAETLWLLLSHLADTGEFHPDSEPVVTLRSPLMSSAGLGPDGAARHPTGRRKA